MSAAQDFEKGLAATQAGDFVTDSERSAHSAAGSRRKLVNLDREEFCATFLDGGLQLLP